MSLYAGVAAVVDGVLASVGGPIVFVRDSGAYDPATDTRAAGTTTATLRGVQDLPTDGFPLDAAVRSADEVVYVRPVPGFTPRAGDRVSGWRGSNWRVESTQAVAPDGAVVVLLAVGLRRP